MFKQSESQSYKLKTKIDIQKLLEQPTKIES